MAMARERSQRLHLVELVAVFWSQDADLEEFIRCGDLGGGRQALPYSPAVLQAMASSEKLRFKKG